MTCMNRVKIRRTTAKGNDVFNLIRAKYMSRSNQLIIDTANAVAEIVGHKKKTKGTKGNAKKEAKWRKIMQMKL